MRNRKQSAATVRIQKYDAGLPPAMVVHMRDVDSEKSRSDRRNVELLVQSSGKNEVFLLCELGTVGRKKWMQWYAHLLPEQIDRLISALTAARNNLKAIS